MGAHKIFKTAALGIISIAACLILTSISFAANESSEYDSRYLDAITMIEGELVSVKVSALTRVSVTDPTIADIADATDNEILLVGKSEGQTALFIWDESGKRTIMVRVFLQDLESVKARIENVLKVADVYEVKLSVNEQEGKVYLSGGVPKYKKDKLEEALVNFTDVVVDLTEEELIEDLVQVDMQITEMSTSVTRSLGIDWFTGEQTSSDGAVSTTSSGAFAPTVMEILPSREPGLGDLFKVGKFVRPDTSAFVAKINALVQEGKAHILSKPKIVVISGEQASFLVGGEIPIRTTTISSSGGSQENVDFKKYGISMTITPTIKKEKVDIIMNIEVSDVDAATASTISDSIAFSTRSASTHLFLDDHQMIILAGLIKTLDSEIETRIPFLSKVPIMGILFRSKANPVPETDLELVIALTPHIMRQKESMAANEALSSGNYRNPVAQGQGVQLPTRPRALPYYLGIPKEMTEYVNEVQRRISQAIIYPQEARDYGWEGTVKLGVLILNDGTLAFALVKEASGHTIFDEIALNTAKKLAPFSAFPSDTDLQELNITIPIVYSLNSKR